MRRHAVLLALAAVAVTSPAAGDGASAGPRDLALRLEQDPGDPLLDYA